MNIKLGMKNFEWKDAIYLGVVILLIIAQSMCKNRKPKTETVVETVIKEVTKRDTVKIDVPAIIPAPDTVFITKIVEKEVPYPVVKLDTFIEYRVEYVKEDVPLFKYNDVIKTQDYDLEYQINTFGELESFTHSLTMHREPKITQNFNERDLRNWILYGAVGYGADVDGNDEVQRATLGILRTKEVIVFGGYYSYERVSNTHELGLSAGIRF